MNIALLLAAGEDPNFRMDISKQFVNVYSRPVIVYTMEIFQNHPDIDVIMVACLKGWENMVNACAKQFGVDKLKWVIPGGKTGQETSRLAVEKGIACENDTNNMISKLGRNVSFSKGSDLNMKINTVEDVAMFKALYAMRNGDI